MVVGLATNILLVLVTPIKGNGRIAYGSGFLLTAISGRVVLKNTQGKAANKNKNAATGTSRRLPNFETATPNTGAQQIKNGSW